MYAYMDVMLLIFLSQRGAEWEILRKRKLVAAALMLANI